MHLHRLWSALMIAAAAVLVWSVVSPATTASASAADGPTYQMPSVGQCRNLTESAVAKESNGSKLVPCSGKHNDQVVGVATLPAGSDWSNTSVSDPIIFKTCEPALRKAAGTTWRGLARSAYTFTWYIPTAAQRAHGATWLRCDANIFTAQGLRTLPRRLKLPSTPGTALQHCIQVGADASAVGPMTCASAHNFQADATVAIPGTTYPDSWQLTKLAVNRCPGADPKKVYWTWTNEDEWSFGDRVLTCYRKTTPGNAVTLTFRRPVRSGIADDNAPAAQKAKVIASFPYTAASLRPRSATVSSDSRLITVKVRFNAIHRAVVKRHGFIYKDAVEFGLVGNGFGGNFYQHSPGGVIHAGQSRVVRCATGHGSLRLRATSTTLTATMARGCFPARDRMQYQVFVEQAVTAYATSAPNTIVRQWYADFIPAATWTNWI